MTDDIVDAMSYYLSRYETEPERTPEEKLEDLLLRKQPEDMGPWTGGVHWDGKTLTINGTLEAN
jgi:hypothetical protein